MIGNNPIRRAMHSPDHPKWEYLSGHLQEVVVCNNGSGGSMGGRGGPPVILRPN